MWSGVNPTEWAKRAIASAQQAPRMVVEQMANAMATRIGVGGFTPVDTGNLSRSVTISLVPVKVDPEGYHSPVRQSYNDVVKGLPYEGAVFVAYKARYARRVNDGFVGTDILGRQYNQAGRGFLEANVARFPQIVGQVASRLKAGYADD